MNKQGKDDRVAQFEEKVRVLQSGEGNFVFQESPAAVLEEL